MGLFKLSSTLILLLVTPNYASQDDYVAKVTSSGIPYQQLTNQINKPLTDQRTYHGLKLENHLKVLLISDPEADKSAAALDVMVGFQSDPKEVLGLAHFCEHLLFMGNKKYPNEADFSKYLKSNSGLFNAFTAFEHTNYFFEIGNSALEGGLDRFSQFFISPLFAKDSIEREARAVDSEHKKNLQSDLWRIRQVQKNVSNPDHPYSQFFTGTYETLLTYPKSLMIDPRQEIIKYYKKHYSANQMRLVVIGKESPEQLAEMVVPKFSMIPNWNANLPTAKGSPFSPATLATKISIVPVGEQRRLTLQFEIPSEFELYNRKPSVFISYLLDNEGPGSVIAKLKKLRWADEMSSRVSEDNAGFAIFEINIGLTVAGLNHTEDIMKLLFEMVNIVKASGITKEYFDEQNKIGNINFKYKERVETSTYAYRLAGHMHSPAPLQSVLELNNIVSNFDPKIIMTTLNQLTPRNLRVTVESKEINNQQDLQTEPWYGTKFSVQKLDEAFLLELESLATNHISSNDLKLPEPNTFISNNFNLVGYPRTNSKPPLLLSNTSSHLLLHTFGKLQVPKASLHLMIKNGISSESPLNFAKLDLLNEILIEDLSEFGYNAQAAGLVYKLEAQHPGLSIMVEGYSQKLELLLYKVISKLNNLNLTPALFDLCKERLQLKQINFNFNEPYQFAPYYTHIALTDRMWPMDQIRKETLSITREDIINFIDQFVRQSILEMQVVGNLTPEKSKEIMEKVSRSLSIGSNSRIKPSQGDNGGINLPSRSVELPKGDLVHQITLADPNNVNSAIGYFLDTHSYTDLAARAYTQLLGQMIWEPAYSQLRTKEQLGYIVNAVAYPLATRGGLLLIIQSEKDPVYLESRIDNFLDNFVALLNNMTERELSDQVQSLANTIKLKQQNLNQQSEFYWKAVTSGFYNFNQDGDMVSELGKLTKPKMLKMVNNLIPKSSKDRRKISIHLNSAMLSPSTNYTGSYTLATCGKLIKGELPAWRATQNLSPFPKLLE